MHETKRLTSTSVKRLVSRMINDSGRPIARLVIEDDRGGNGDFMVDITYAPTTAPVKPYDYCVIETRNRGILMHTGKFSTRAKRSEGLRFLTPLAAVKYLREHPVKNPLIALMPAGTLLDPVMMETMSS